MTKSVALSRAEARIENMNTEISDLKDMVAKLCLAVAAKAAPEPVTPAPVAHRDDWIPRLDVIEPQLKRPPLAVFDDREAAWEFRNAIAPTLSHPVAVGWKGKALRSPAGPVWVVY